MFETLVQAAKDVGVIEATLLFVVFVLSVFVFRLLNLLRQAQSDQARINSTMIENLVELSQRTGTALTPPLASDEKSSDDLGEQ